ncbi:transporter [Poritiphilus flavus]|uniref:Transporter n=1 Tax=Poritiphilus flavus TaxID=2697053 RepID=A0A6L9EFQ5_9FLAO|nr:transporter [Poritiphilus flavus]NAS13483.1 transporter [Poritiphilus flavus]
MGRLFGLKTLKTVLLFLVFTLPITGFSQYTDVINSNRPGLSVSAYAVGKNVFQIEGGLFYEQQDHSKTETESNIWGADLSLRYGLFFEQLEIHWEGRFQDQNLSVPLIGYEDSRTNFYRNRIGLKYLIYDRYKDPQRNKPNLYSWRANNLFQLKNLIPSVSVYAGANFLLGDNPFFAGDPTISPRVMVATQSRLTPRFVLISNIAYDRIGTDFPEFSYLVSLSHAFRNPKWSVFVEHQGIDSDRYSDLLIRSGVAHLISENLQADINLGSSFKSTPSRIFITAGASYRFDFHQDELLPAKDPNNQYGVGPIKKNSMKKNKKKNKKRAKKGKGAEDIDLGPSKKQLRKKKRQLKKGKKKDDSIIDF